MSKIAELEAKLAALEAANAEAEARAKAAEAKAAAATQAKTKHSGITLKVSENAKALSIYGMQSRPVTLYGSQMAKILTVHKAEITAFILANADALAWKSAEEKAATLALLTPAETAETVPAA